VSGPTLPGPGQPAVVVRAAGGAVWRRGPAGVEVLLIHRPRYDDWSLPKGKVDPGEADEDAAVREVAEEASVVARLGIELPSTEYLDRSGKFKTVRYWAMTVAGGAAGPDNEVDSVEWLPLDQARARLSYARDTAVLDALEEAVDGAARLAVVGFDHVALHVADVERSLEFYGQRLGLPGERVGEWREGRAPFPSVRAGAATIIDLLGPREGVAPGREDGGGLDHLCLVVAPTDLAAVVASGAFDVIDGPGPRYGAQGWGTSIYVRDPDGYVVELRHYG
jgi:8-oxo-dGTP pyrophosphatase MutT (NUDIX family)/catechol 2,3-dioxygenase-like lactoylglutathione lyase family enzyme